MSQNLGLCSQEKWSACICNSFSSYKSLLFPWSLLNWWILNLTASCVHGGKMAEKKDQWLLIERFRAKIHTYWNIRDPALSASCHHPLYVTSNGNCLLFTIVLYEATSIKWKPVVDKRNTVLEPLFLAENCWCKYVKPGRKRSKVPRGGQRRSLTASNNLMERDCLKIPRAPRQSLIPS